MVLAAIRKAPEVIPLLVIIGTAATGATAFLIRQATKNPDACWDRKNNPHPWLHIKENEQVKLYSPSHHSQMESVKKSD